MDVGSSHHKSIRINWTDILRRGSAVHMALQLAVSGARKLVQVRRTMSVQRRVGYQEHMENSIAHSAWAEEKAPGITYIEHGNPVEKQLL